MQLRADAELNVYRAHILSENISIMGKEKGNWV
jgi:hypothetical protein